MKQAGPSASYESCISATTQRIAPLGYDRKGMIFRKWADGNCGLIQFQKARRNTNERLEFTVNLAVICGQLFEDWKGDITKASAFDAHFQVRLGMLLPERRDKWWLIDGTTDSGALASEISSFVCDLGVPYIARHMRTADLIALWRSGISPGATEVQRLRYLSILEN